MKLYTVYTFTFQCLLLSVFLGSRYIELFLHSSPSTSGSVAQYSYAYPAYAVSVYVIMYMYLLSCQCTSYMYWIMCVTCCVAILCACTHVLTFLK